MTWIEILGYIGAAFSIATNSMRTMVPLRCMGIVTNVIFLVYGGLMGLYPTIIVNAVALPMNTIRLTQMLRLIKKVRLASSGDLSMDWLKPYMSRRRVEKGDVLFMKGDTAECLFYTLSGRYRLAESGIEIGGNQMVGEMGLVAPDQRRTQSLACFEGGEVLTISYDQVRQLYFQNPEFGFYFLRLTSARLFENMARMEQELQDLRSTRALLGGTNQAA